MDEPGVNFIFKAHQLTAGLTDSQVLIFLYVKTHRMPGCYKHMSRGRDAGFEVSQHEAVVLVLTHAMAVYLLLR